MDSNFGKALDILGPMLLDGAVVVVEITILGFISALIVALLLAIGRMSKIAPIRWILTAFLEIIRGTPLLVQLFYVYYVIPLVLTSIFTAMGMDVDVQLKAFTAGVIGFAINYGCYLSEVIRSAIVAIDEGQREAGLALGFSETQVLFKLIVPPALRNSIPVFGNYLVMMVKDTSLLSVITVSELLLKTQAYASQTFNVVSAYTLLAIVYFIISFPLSRLMMLIESRMNKVNRR